MRYANPRLSDDLAFITVLHREMSLTDSEPREGAVESLLDLQDKADAIGAPSRRTIARGVVTVGVSILAAAWLAFSDLDSPFTTVVGGVSLVVVVLTGLVWARAVRRQLTERRALELEIEELQIRGTLTSE